MNLDARKYCIVGTGGFGRETLTCLIDAYAATGGIEEKSVFMVEDEYYSEAIIMGVPVIKQSDFHPKEYKVVVAIGDPKIRKSVVSNLPPETRYTSIIHPTAVVSKWVEIGEGSIITAGTKITCNINIGKHAHLNLNTTIGHDCEMGDFFTTAPGVNISGGCSFGECVYLGSNASIRQGINICNDVTIGMGGVVVKDVEEQGVYIGNPVRKLSK